MYQGSKKELTILKVLQIIFWKNGATNQHALHWEVDNGVFVLGLGIGELRQQYWLAHNGLRMGKGAREEEEQY